MKYRRDIDGLRAVAVLPVVLDHAHVPGFGGGYVGVDIFFVISGFLITRILADEIAEGRFSLLGFYERRARRILPALFAMMALVLVAGWWMLVPGQYEDLGESVLAATFFFSNYHFLWIASDYFAPNAEFLPLLHTWSLAVEEQYYIVYPLLLLALTGLFGARAWLGVAVLSALSLVWVSYLIGETPVAAFYATPGRAWELGLGGLVALVGHRVTLSSRVADALAIVAAAAILLPIFLYSADTPFPGLAALPPVAGAALLIWTGATRATPVARLLSWAPLVGIGLISYSLYLWHWPILVGARLWVGDGILSPGLIVTCLLAALGAAALSWRLVERPFRKPAQKGGLGRKSIFAASAVGAVLLYTAGSTIDTEDGYAQRMPPELAGILATAEEHPMEVLGCGDMPTQTDLCRLGAEGEASRVLLVGDSHARALGAGFDALLKDLGLGGDMLAVGGCRPMIDVREVVADPDCVAMIDKLFRLLDDQTYETVIVAARWPLAVEGYVSGRAAGPRMVHVPVAGSDLAAELGNAELVAVGMRRLVSRIAASTERVILIEGVPEIGYDVPQIYASSVLLGANLRPAPGRDETIARQSRASEMQAGIAAELDNVVFIPLIDTWCETTCPIATAGDPVGGGGRIYYRDDNHLSKLGAERLIAEHLRAPLAEALTQ